MRCWEISENHSKFEHMENHEKALTRDENVVVNWDKENTTETCEGSKKYCRAIDRKCPSVPIIAWSLSSKSSRWRNWH